MKQCPTCARTYADDTLAFCLDDGTALLAPIDPQQTLRIPAARPTDWPVTPYASGTQPAPSKSKWPIIILVTLLVVGLLAGAIGLAIFGYARMSASQSKQGEQGNDRNGQSWSNPSPAASPTPRTASALVGTWRTNVYENGESTEITVTFLSDGNERYAFKDARGRTASDTGSWQYSDATLFERFSTGASGKGSIRWIDDDTFEITIIDNGVPAYNGLKRTYRRVS